MDITSGNPREIIEEILKKRGIENIEAFLDPMEEDLLGYDVLPNLDKACSIVEEGLEKNKKFGVLYDVDTDGVMAGTIMTRYLRDLNADVLHYINEGKAHGTTDGFLMFCRKVDIVIIVDSLDSTVANYEKIYDMGKEIIVLDHHHIENQPYDKYITLVSSYGTENDQLSGGGVVYKFINYIDDELGFDFASQYADLCCCALLGDMMSVGEDYMENRFLVKDGLEHLKNKTLKKIVGGFGFNSRAVAFSVAPKINACQRLNNNQLAVDAFLTDNDTEIKNYISEFNKLKTIQDKTVDKIMKNSQEQIEEQSKKDKTIFVIIENRDAPLSGLVANKILGMYKKPAFVVRNNNGYYSGSCRSTNTKDMRQICEDSGYGKFLGHPNSFGIIGIADYNLHEFKSYLEDYLTSYKFNATEDYDAEFDILDISEDFISEVKKVDKISGTGFGSLTFKVNISDYVIGEMGKGKHVYLSPRERDNVRMIIWNASPETKKFLSDAELFGSPLYCIGTLDSGWFGRKFYLQVITDEFKLQ